MVDVEAVLSKVKKPPAIQNWVRLNDRRRDETARRIASFVLAKPRHALAQIYGIIANYVTFGLSGETAAKALLGIKNPLVRKLGREIFRALLPWIDAIGIKGIQVFHNLSVPFPIGRGVSVPVKPTFVFLHEGRLTPVFVIGWASVPFTEFQKSLLSTVIHEALLTLEGFETSDALIVCVPRLKGSKSERYVRHWKVSDVPMLTGEQLREQFDRFGNALEDAVPIVLDELARRGDL